MLDQRHTNAIYKNMMKYKGKTMSVIMYSPLMHNAVIWGKAVPADPVGVLSLRAYFRGNAARNDPATMKEALRAGVDPVGHRYFNQDLTAIASPDTIAPGRSWTAKELAFIPGLFDKNLSDAVKRKVDQLGNLMHNTMLWDRIADLQMGLYVHIRDWAVDQGADPQSAQRLAAHFANRYAGALPMESMSRLARASANMVFFSRSFTFTNMGAYKDAMLGLPRDVQAQIERDAGTEELNKIQGLARRKGLGMLIMDILLSKIGNLAAAWLVWWFTTKFLDELREFVPPSENEPGKTDRFLIGFTPEGQAIYGRWPMGKVGEEMTAWATEPIAEQKKKFSPLSRLIYEYAANDKGFGRKAYDPYVGMFSAGNAANIGGFIWNAIDAHLPNGLIEGVAGLTLTDDAKKRLAPNMAGFGLNVPRTAGEAWMQTILPLAGVTISHGAPGGPAAGEYFSAKDEHAYQVLQAMPSIRTKIKLGDLDGAAKDMTALGLDKEEQRFAVRNATNPGARLSKGPMKRFGLYATPEQKDALTRAQQAQPRR